MLGSPFNSPTVLSLPATIVGYMHGNSTTSDTDGMSRRKKALPVTLQSLTIALAYMHAHVPRRLPDARYLSPTHLRQLAEWLELPQPQLRSLREHRLLAAHIALLEASGLLATAASRVALLPAAFNWLFAPPREQKAQLLSALAGGAWAETVRRLRAEKLFTLDYTAYLQQLLQRQDHSTMEEKPYARWQALGAESWQLSIVPWPPTHLLFDLLQLGQWAPGDRTVTLTPLSVATAVQRGYQPDYLLSLLHLATGDSISPRALSDFRHWTQRATAYQVQVATVLTTQTREQAAAFVRQRRFRKHIRRQLSARDFLVAEDGLPQLQRWLASRGYPLVLPSTPGSRAPDPLPNPPAYEWLGLRLLIGLGELIPLPYGPPHAQLEQVGTQLTPAQLSELEALSRQLIDSLRQAITGRDAFFPAEHLPSAELLTRVNRAIASGGVLDVDYQGLGDSAPRRRRLHPLRLEQRGQLTYLHAYCELAGAERIFRLDRFHDCHES